MKILIATESYYPNISGVAVFSHNLAKKMIERGHEVYVIAPSPKFAPYFEVFEGVKIYRLPSKINKYRHGYYVSKNPFAHVKKIIYDIRPDVVHLQDPAMIAVSCAYQAKRLKIPIVITNHFSLEYVITYLPYLKPLHPLILLILTHYLNWFYAKGNVLTCPTQTTAEHFIKTGIKINVDVISNGVDLSRFMPYYGNTLATRDHFKIPRKLPIVLYTGRLDIDKNVNQLILAIPKVLQRIAAHFVIVGSGKEKANLENLAKKLKIEKHLSFTGAIAHNDRLLPEIYQASSVFVDPCPRETQGIVVLEAQATGLPVVAANSGALVELVKNDINGYRFEANNIEDLAQKIIHILQAPRKAKKMGEKNLEVIEKHLVDDTHDEFEKIYLKLTK